MRRYLSFFTRKKFILSYCKVVYVFPVIHSMARDWNLNLDSLKLFFARMVLFRSCVL
jgi:hypothetical protein